MGPHFVLATPLPSAVPARAGGIYQIRLQFPDQYPEKPPKVKFVTEMFHPNSALALCCWC